ncbi:RxLR effector protein [Phytophthora megakarya]|uniref:RxLR effector protein n=1 Tax=Phytophthora megakarya TaxID=4795 RepID=A0A225W941_9STRA|nr:RxLR effector protein [Phytophthora megakarya]
MRFRSLFVLVVVTFAASCFNVVDAKQEAVIKPYWVDKWQSAISKIKVINVLNPSKLRAQTTSDKAWETASVKLNAGAKLEKLDTSPSGKWKTTFDQFKATSQLKNVDEAQAAKITETVAQEVAKNPSKWRYIKKIALITFGAVATALIIVGLVSMIKQ